MPEPNKIESLFEANRKLWDERVGIDLAPGGYDLTVLRAGRGRLHALVETELAELVGDLVGKRVIHLQCHIGNEVLSLAQRGAEVVGVDFSPAAPSPPSLASPTARALSNATSTTRPTWSVRRGSISCS